MKTVFTNDEIPHLWAHKAQPHARGTGSISFRDETGYSYAMPICRHAKAKDGTPCILFTTDGYSVTTSKHKSMFYRAIPSGVPVYRVHDVLATGKASHAANVKERDEHLARLSTEAHKARPGTLKAQNLAAELQSEIANRNAYAQAFGVRVKPLSEAEAVTLAQKLAQEAEKAVKRAQKAALARQREMAAEFALAFPQWLSGERENLPCQTPYSGAYLRVNGDEMETSQGARVPLTHAKRAVARVVKVRASGQSWHRNGSTLPVGHYHIDSISETGDVVAGCHRIAWEEIERFAKSQGWL